MPRCSRRSDRSLRVRRAHAADVSSMMDMEIQSPGGAHWSRQQYECLFSTSGSQGPSERLAWVVENDSQKQPDEVPDGKIELLGCLVTRRIDKAWQIKNIVVAEKARY